MPKRGRGRPRHSPEQREASKERRRKYQTKYYLAITKPKRQAAKTNHYQE